MKNMLKFGLVLAIFAGLSSLASASVPTKVVQEALEQAAKLSGKFLSPAAKEAAELALKKAITQHGDDVLRTVRLGGLEALEQGAKYGDEFWQLCAQAPNGARSLALHADDLKPLAKRVGPVVIQIEAKAPGMALHASKFGDDALHTLGKAPANDIPRLVGFAEKADSKKTQKLLFNCYNKSQNKAAFLQALNWKNIMATGLSAAAVFAAWNASDGIHDAINTVAEKSPESVPALFCYLFYAILSVGGIFLLYLLRYPIQQLARHTGNRIRRRKVSIPEEKTEKIENSPEICQE